jgi:hypothetical protein
MKFIFPLLYIVPVSLLSFAADSLQICLYDLWVAHAVACLVLFFVGFLKDLKAIPEPDDEETETLVDNAQVNEHEDFRFGAAKNYKNPYSTNNENSRREKDVNDFAEQVKTGFSNINAKYSRENVDEDYSVKDVRNVNVIDASPQDVDKRHWSVGL